MLRIWWRNIRALDFVEIHLDASMACAGEKPPLPDYVVADRAARLYRITEESSRGLQPPYVIGTQVPLPGASTRRDLVQRMFRETDKPK